VSQLIYVAARLGIADELAGGPRTTAVLAKKVGAHEPSLRRVLRALAGLGIFAETANGRFKLTPLGATLRSDVKGSLRPFALMMVDGYNWNAWGQLLHGTRTGQLPFNHVYGMPLFEYLREHPDADREFSAAMASISGPENDAIARAFDFGRFTTLVDVGGAHGHLLATVLGRHRRVRGILYDQPQVVAGAGASGFITAPAVAARCTTKGGDFFTAVPTGADAYMMKYIIHDWTDDQCVRILGHCRHAMAPDGRVLVVEHVIRPGNAPDWAKLLDVNMLVLPGGRERTKEEFAALFTRAGLRLKRIHKTASALSVLEAAPV
jgi:hypothetical protein